MNDVRDASGRIALPGAALDSIAHELDGTADYVEQGINAVLGIELQPGEADDACDAVGLQEVYDRVQRCSQCGWWWAVEELCVEDGLEGCCEHCLEEVA